MKTFKFAFRFISLLLTITLLIIMAVPTMIFAAQPTVNLGTTSTFAVLAGSGITNTGTTIINGDAGGDVGSSPTGTFTGQASVTLSGAVHLADATALTAKNDLVIAYNDAAGRLPVTRIPTELGGTTLFPGVYDSASGTFGITGTLTLDAQGDPEGVFIFKTASTLITAGSSNVSLINSARYCRTFWQVGSSATLGVNSHFVGHIFALASITANNGATVQGQLLARNGAVTLDNNTITNGVCLVVPVPVGGGQTSPPIPPLINVIKTPSPLALTSGQGLVTYTYTVNNPGTVTLSDVSVTDDKINTVTYVSGDIDGDNQLQNFETWIYTAKMNLTETTTNTATARGSANYMTATDIALATVVVSQAAPVYPPLINVIKTPSPLALPSGQGLVTYTYKVNNPGMVALSNVSVVDNKISTVTYVSGDTNGDKLLQTGEIWTYTAKMNLTATTTNTATAKGSANGMTATDIAIATVVVSQETPLINVIKTPSPLALTSGQGLVTYTYRVNNPGMVALSNVSVADDKINIVTYVSGDVNGDKLLQTSEIWIYTAKMNLTETTTNTATAKGSANGITATDIAIATVEVTQPIVVIETITGGQLPNTSTPLYEAIFIGAVLVLIGAIGWRSKKRYE